MWISILFPLAIAMIFFWRSARFARRYQSLKDTGCVCTGTVLSCSWANKGTRALRLCFEADGVTYKKLFWIPSEVSYVHGMPVQVLYNPDKPDDCLPDIPQTQKCYRNFGILFTVLAAAIAVLGLMPDAWFQ